MAELKNSRDADTPDTPFFRGHHLLSALGLILAQPIWRTKMNKLAQKAGAAPFWMVIAAYTLGIFIMLLHRRSAEWGISYGGFTAAVVFLATTAGILAERISEFRSAFVITETLLVGLLFVGYAITAMYLVASLTSAVPDQQITYWAGGLLGLAASTALMIRSVEKLKKEA